MGGTPRTRSVIYAEKTDSGFSNSVRQMFGCTTSGNPLPTTLPLPNKVILNWYKTMEDVVDANFYERRSRGEIFNNPLKINIYKKKLTPMVGQADGRIERYGCTPSRWYTTETKSWDLKEYFEETRLVIPVFVADTLRSQAIASAHSKVSVAEILALVSFKESKETIRMFANASRKINKYLKTLRKKWFLKTSLRYAKNFRINDLADAYLEARYGIRPLIYDVKGILAALNAELQNRRQTFRGWSLGSVEATPTSSTQIWNNLMQWGYTHTTVQKFAFQQISIRAGVLSAIESVTMLNAFGIDRLSESLLDVIPFSFIINWFFNVQDTVGSLTPNYGIKDLASWVTTEKITTYLSLVERKVVPHSDLSTTRYVGSSNFTRARCEETLTEITREPNPRRSLLPTVSVNLDGAKLLDLAAIGKSLWFRGGKLSLYQQALLVEAKLRRRR